MYYWFFFCKQKTAYEVRISDWSSDVCSSDLAVLAEIGVDEATPRMEAWNKLDLLDTADREERLGEAAKRDDVVAISALTGEGVEALLETIGALLTSGHRRSEEHTSELQSLMRISYAVFCLKKKTERVHVAATPRMN